MPLRFTPLSIRSLVQRDLSADEVEVWSLDLNPPAEMVSELAVPLSPDERERAARFVFERDRRRFNVCRGALRLLLAAYTGASADAIRFRYGKRGKPELAGGEIQFNVSHSEDLALLAFSLKKRLGIDLEHLHPVPELEHIAQSHFSPAEQEVMARMPSDLKQVAFFNCWTRKEAFIKALGDGFYFSLEKFDVTLAPDEPPRIVSILGRPEHAAEWSLYHLNPRPGFVGALAAAGVDLKLATWTLEW